MNTIAIFKIIFRGWWRNKLFILISLISLTVGLGCTNLLVTFFIHEYNIEQQTPDRHLRTATRLSDGRRCKSILRQCEHRRTNKGKIC